MSAVAAAGRKAAEPANAVAKSEGRGKDVEAWQHMQPLAF